jgi:broad specificity phosphatase PhoE
MDRTRFAFALAAFLLWAPAWSQTAEPQRSSLPSRELPPAELLAELRKGGYILYFRHAATDFSQNDERMKSYEDCAGQRNLIDKGRSDARAIGAAIRELRIPVERVLASPFCRTVETAQLLFGRAEKMQEVRGGPSAPASSERYAALRRILATPVRAGNNLAVVSHGNPFYSVAGPPYLAEGEAAVIRPLGADFQVIARIRIDSWEGLRNAAGAGPAASTRPTARSFRSGCIPRGRSA